MIYYCQSLWQENGYKKNNVSSGQYSKNKTI